MTNLEPYLNLALYIVNSFFFSIYIVPQLKHIRSIKNKLYAFDLPLVENVNSGEEDEQRKKIREYDSLLRKYASEYQDIIKLINISYLGIFVVMVGMSLVLLKSSNFDYLSINFTSLIVLDTVSTLMFVCIYAHHFYIPSPGEFSKWSYLIKKNGFVQDNLLNCANFHGSIHVEKSGAERIAKIVLNTIFPINGYKYLVCIFDQDKKLIYKKFGIVTDEDKLRKVDINGGKSSFNYLSHSLNIGKFTINASGESDLKMFLFIFDPCIDEDDNSPLFGIGSYHLTPSTISYITDINIRNIKAFTYIKYCGKDLRFKHLTWQDQEKYSTETSEYVDNLKVIINKTPCWWRRLNN